MLRLRFSRRAVAAIVVPSVVAVGLVAIPATSAVAAPNDQVAPVTAAGAGYTQSFTRSDGAVTATYAFTNAGANRTLGQDATATAAMNTRDPNGAVAFSPTGVATSTGAQLDNVSSAGCAASTATTRTDCGADGTLTITFSRPVTNPTLHIAGLGGSVGGTADTFASYFDVTGSQSSTAGANTATFGALQGTPTDLEVANGRLRTTDVAPGSRCSGTQPGGQTSAAGCGSVQITGTNLTSVTLTAGLYQNAAADTAAGTALSDALNLDVTIPNVAPLDAAFACQANSIYALNSPDGAIEKVDNTTGNNTFVGKINVPAGTRINAFGITRGGGFGYAIGQTATGNGATTVYRYDPTTDTTTSFAGPTVDANANITSGAVNPADGIYYFGYTNSGNGLQIFGFNTNTNTPVTGQIADINIGTTAGVNGDFAFSRLGLLVFVASTGNSSATANPIYYVPSRLATDGSNPTPTAKVVSYATPNDSTFNGLAFDSPSGYLYVNSITNGQAVLRQLNPTSGDQINAYPQTYDGAASAPVGGTQPNVDLATCQYNNSIRSRANITARVNAGDQFGVKLTGGGIGTDVDISGTTAGTDTGLQDGITEEAGPVPSLAGSTYTFTQTAANGTDLNNYVTTWTCTNLVTGATVASGTGNTGTVTFPTPPDADGIPLACDFTDTPKDASIDVSITSDKTVYRQGDTVTYTVSVKNTSNNALSNVVVNDPSLAACNRTIGNLAVGATQTYTCTTTAPVPNGTNTVTATGQNTLGTQATDTDSVTVRTINPSISLTDTASPTTVNQVGQTVTYTYVVTNTGDSTLTNIGVASTPTAPAGNRTVTCQATTLAAGANTTCTATYQVTQADIQAGSIREASVATGTPETGANVSSTTQRTTVTAVRTAGISLVKTASRVSVYTVGQAITYSFKVTNTGNVAVTDPTVTDTFSTGADLPVTCPAGSIAPGDSATCTATYQVTQADKTRGSITNTAVANATGPTGVTVPQSASSSATVAVIDGLTVTGTSNPTSATNAGTPITYTYTVTNNTTDTVGGLVLPATGPNGQTLPSTCALTTLPAGQSTTCTVTYTPTQADIDSGTVPVTGTARGTTPDTTLTSAPVTVTVPVAPTSGLTIAGTSNPTSVSAPGTPITYTFTVTNNGNQTVTNPTLNATGPNGQPLTGETCAATSIKPGDFTTCTVTYTPTQADIDSGSVPVTGTATATAPGNTPVSSQPTTVATPVAPTSGLTIAGTSNPTSVSTPGTPITYTFTVTNNGNQTVTNPTLNATGPNGQPLTGEACAATSIRPGDSTTCTVTYTPTQADIDRGSVPVTGTATATRPGNTPVSSQPTTVAVPVNPTGGLTVSGNSNPTSVSAPGTPITYTYTVTNNSNQTVTNPTLDATGPNGQALTGETCAATSIAPGDSTTCTVTYTPTQADIDSGSVPVTGTVGATAPGNKPVTAQPVTVAVPVAPTTGLTIAGTSNPTTVSAPGTPITYTFTVTNNGNQTVTNPVLTATGPSGQALTGETCAATSILPGGSTTCTVTYTPTQADIDSGSVPVTGVASATAPGNKPVASQPTTVPVPVNPSKGLTIAGTVNPTSVSAAGDKVTYTFTVTNNGNQSVSGLTVPVTLPDGTVVNATCAATTLAPNGSTPCTVTYTTTQADINAGTVPATGTANATAPGNTPVASQPATVAATVNPTSGLSLAGTSNPTSVATAGTPIQYTFTVTNNGNQTVTNPVLTATGPGGQALTGEACAATSIAPGASITCTVTYTPTQADIDNGSVPVTGTVSGTTPGNNPVASPPVTVPVPVNPNSGLTIAGTSNPTSVSKAGDVITYTFTVTNNGNQSVSGLTVPVNLPDGTTVNATCAQTTLAPNASTPCTVTYTTTQADINAGSVPATGTANATAPGNKPVTSQPTTVPVAVNPNNGLTIAGTANPTSVSNPGDKVTYTFTVTNNGNQTVNGLTVPVTLPDGTVVNATCAQTTLAPNASTPCTVDYTVTQKDIDNGSAPATGTANATAPGNKPVASPPATVAVPVNPSEGLTIAGQANPTSVSAPGDKVTYTFTVTNNGNQTVDGLTVPVTLPDGTVVNATCAATTLTPSGSTTCTVTYTATQADIDNGSLPATATATATAPGNTPVSSAPTTVAVPVLLPSVRIVKTGKLVDVDRSGTPTAKDRIDWSVKVTNTGNTTITGIAVNDPTAGAVTCPVTSLKAGASTTCTVKPTTLTQALIDSGSATNTATVTANGGGKALTDSSTATVGLTADARLSATKTGVVTDVNRNDVTDAGDRIVWRITVVNAGNVTLTTVAVSDPKGGKVTCASTTLAPGATTVCTTAARVITAAESASGRLVNTATASGLAPDGKAVTSDPTTATVATAGADGAGAGNGGTPGAGSGVGSGGEGSGTGGVSGGGTSSGSPASTGVQALPQLIGIAIGLLILGSLVLVVGIRRRRT